MLRKIYWLPFSQPNDLYLQKKEKEAKRIKWKKKLSLARKACREKFKLIRQAKRKEKKEKARVEKEEKQLIKAKKNWKKNKTGCEHLSPDICEACVKDLEAWTNLGILKPTSSGLWMLSTYRLKVLKEAGKNKAEYKKLLASKLAKLQSKST